MGKESQTHAKVQSMWGTDSQNALHHYTPYKHQTTFMFAMLLRNFEDHNECAVSGPTVQG